MGITLNLSEKFDEYFNEVENYSLRSERFYDSFDNFTNKQALAASMKLWLEAAFIQGAKTMADDSVETLFDYATALAGIDEVCYTREQAFDEAAKNLAIYVTYVLNKAEGKC